jgi:hypothetical protein
MRLNSKPILKPTFSAPLRAFSLQMSSHIPFAIENLLNEERGFGGDQPAGLAAASIWAAAPPRRGGAPQNTTDPHSETLCIKVLIAQ